jgi:hypothetical protein
MLSKQSMPIRVRVSMVALLALRVSKPQLDSTARPLANDQTSATFAAQIGPCSLYKDADPQTALRLRVARTSGGAIFLPKAVVSLSPITSRTGILRSPNL